MTLRKKLWITVACLSVILCTLVTGTIAWLTDKTPEVKNTFTPSNIGISLAETTGGNSKEFQMVPGRTIAKDPKVTVAANSEACYVFIEIKESTNFKTYMTYAVIIGDNEWKALDGVAGVYYREVTADDAKNGVTYDVLGAGNVTINGVQYSWAANQVLVLPSVSKADMQAIYNNPNLKPTLTFTAYACQVEGFDTPAAAWTEAQKAPATT